MKTLFDNLGLVGRKLTGVVAAKKPSEPVVLRPEGKERGCVVISYITWPFREGWHSSRARGHTNAFEVVAMAEAWRNLGFRVEVCDHDDRYYAAPQDCVVAIDLHSNLERWATKLPSDCVKILHATGCHWQFQNEAEQRRLRALKERRGVALVPRRQVAPTRASEIADRITVLGNGFTIDTFREAGKAITRIPISSAYQFDWPQGRDFESAKRKFLWMGSYGMVHKGLDLVLEAFAATPDLELTVCGRPDKEEDFFSAYKKELGETPNINFRGWIELASDEFQEIAKTHATMLYPSCSEGGGGCVVHCMHAGMLPACTPASSVELRDFGISIEQGTVEGVRECVWLVASMSASEVEQRARQAWESARLLHTRSRFRTEYANFVTTISKKIR